MASKVPTKVSTEGDPKLDPQTGIPVDGVYSGDNAPSKEVLGLVYHDLEDAIVKFAESVKDLKRSRAESQD